ncbi:hypothetical protein OG885_44215 (plasmid) [Streptomyces sp. NBC_00028]|uniref:hypothetical protein n=1 Tax=Streptomyces sp. NBC_00028 TaxID=2975624 RepID=UPI0032533A28
MAELTEHFTALRSRGQGYLEVSLPGDEFPWLTLGFQGAQAVVHLFSDAEKSALLIGDATAAADAVVHVPIMDDPAGFSGDYVLATDHAWALIHRFIQTGEPGELGEWHEL